MRRAYYMLRGIAYTLGIISVLLILWGRRSDSGYAQELMQAGILSAVLTLILFALSYALFGLLQRRRSKPRS